MSKTAFIFPGQGAQTAGMGKDFYENSRKAKDIFDMASELLSLDMRKLCFEKNDLLDKTEYTQAALVTVSMAAEHVLREWGMTADVTAGLSLGEYCAAASAGAFFYRRRSSDGEKTRDFYGRSRSRKQRGDGGCNRTYRRSDRRSIGKDSECMDRKL